MLNVPGPIQSQANFFYRISPTRHSFPTYRYITQTERLYIVLDKRLADREYVAGPGKGHYSIADMAVWPFIDAAAFCGIELERWGNVLDWWERIRKRPAVKKGMCVPSGETFAFGYEVVGERKEKDPEGWEKAEGPLRKALEEARKEFGNV